MRSPFLSRFYEWTILIVLVWLAAFLRFAYLGEQSLWDGEIFTLLFTQFDWNIFIQSVSTFSAHPPLWFALTKIVTTLGWNEMLLRVPAAFAGIASVPALYALGKRMVDTRVGVLSAALLAFSPLDVIFSQNARNYAFFVLLTILLLYGAYRGVQTRRARWWLVFIFSALAGLYTHYLFVLPLAGTVLAIALKLIYDAMRHVGSWKNVRAWWSIALGQARWFLIALIALAALYLPWTPTVGSAFLDRQLTREASNEDETTALTWQDAPRLLKDFSGDASWGMALFASLAVIGIVSAWRGGAAPAHKTRAALFWFGISIVLPILLTVLLAPRRLPAKYLIYVLPAYLLLVAYGIVSVAEFARAFFLKSEQRAWALQCGIVALLAFASIPNMPYWNGRQTVFNGKGWAVVDEWKPWRAAANYVIAHAAPGDAVLFPVEARALTARSVVPYFDQTFLKKLYGAPPTGRVWWVSELKDVPPGNASRVRVEQRFEPVVIQELEPAPQMERVAIANASFEEGLNGWEKSNDAVQWVQDTAQAVEGNASARVTQRGAYGTTMRSNEFPVQPGKLYRVSAYVKLPTVGFYTASPQLFVNFYEPNNRIPRRTRLATLVPTEHPDWVMMLADGTVPEDATTARVEFVFRDYAFAFQPTTWLDDVVVWMEK